MAKDIDINSELSALLARDGYAVVPALLDAEECCTLAGLYDERERFRSRVVMARHGFGQGEYKYLAYPLPDRVAELRPAYLPPDPASRTAYEPGEIAQETTRNFHRLFPVEKDMGH